MLFQLGDKFVVQGILTEVRYINAGKAWVFPIEDEKAEFGRMHLTCVAIDTIDENGNDSKGDKAKSVVNSKGSLAV